MSKINVHSFSHSFVVVTEHQLRVCWSKHSLTRRSLMFASRSHTPAAQRRWLKRGRLSSSLYNNPQQESIIPTTVTSPHDTNKACCTTNINQRSKRFYTAELHQPSGWTQLLYIHVHCTSHHKHYMNTSIHTLQPPNSHRRSSCQKSTDIRFHFTHIIMLHRQFCHM